MGFLRLTGRRNMREYSIKDRQHTVYEDSSELPNNFIYKDNWREGQVGDWVLADDGCYIQILRRNKMTPHRKHKRHAREYVGTCTGTFMVTKSNKMDTDKRHNIYSFGGRKTSSKQLFDREKTNGREELFSLYIAQGVDPIMAYMKAYKTENPKYAEKKAMLLLKTERIKKSVKEEIKPVLKELDINEEFVLRGIRDIALTARQDGERLKAFLKLVDILEIEDKGTKQSGVAMVGFQGFKPESIDAVQKIIELEE